MTVPSQDNEVLATVRENLLKDLEPLMIGQKFIEAVLILEDIIGISQKIGDLGMVEIYYQRVSECIDKYKSIHDDIEILQADSNLRNEIVKERDELITAAQQAATNQQYAGALNLYHKAIEFSVKLNEKKVIWKLSKSITLLENKIKDSGSVVPAVDALETTASPAIASPKPAASPFFKAPEAAPASLKAHKPAASPFFKAPEASIPQIVAPQPAAPMPKFEAPQPAPVATVSTVEEAAAVLGVEESADESDESFLDSIVEDLKVQPQVGAKAASPQAAKKEVPFIAGTIGKKEPVIPVEIDVPFFQAPVEPQKSGIGVAPEEPGLKDIHETADKRTRKKLKLAEKIALKKLQEAEKQFGKQSKKEEKEKEKDLKKKEEEERKLREMREKADKKKKKEKPDKKPKKEEKLKSRYPSALPDDVLSEIKGKKRDYDS
ncbi:MAG: hypothetical protein HWN65_09050 [Candidatus Helarchaeota archaeon]|nr:hypothetical protein [Candidatus Helarchaeota archaeon]